MALDKNVPLVTNTIAEDLIAINANWEAIVSDIAYDVTTWDAVIDIAPSKNAVRDKIATMDAAIAANTAKNTNVPTALSVGTVNTNTVSITSDGSADDVTLPAATASTAGMLTTAKWAEIVANTNKVTNATHTGDVTGATALAIAAAAVGQAQLKSTTGTVTHTGTEDATNKTLPGGEYGFYPQIKANAINVNTDISFAIGIGSAATPTTSYVTNICIKLGAGESANTITVLQRYIQASGEVHWMFFLIRKSDGLITSIWEAPDHPCYGNRGVIHPFGNVDLNKYDIIVVNPAMGDVERILARTIPSVDGGYLTREKSLFGIEEDYLRPLRGFSDVFTEIFELEEGKEADWPDIPVTVALPKIHNGHIVHDWRFMPQFDQDSKPVKVKPIKRVISKPNYITPLRIKEK